MPRLSKTPKVTKGLKRSKANEKGGPRFRESQNGRWRDKYNKAKEWGQKKLVTLNKRTAKALTYGNLPRKSSSTMATDDETDRPESGHADDRCITVAPTTSEEDPQSTTTQLNPSRLPALLLEFDKNHPSQGTPAHVHTWPTAKKAESDTPRVETPGTKLMTATPSHANAMDSEVGVDGEIVEHDSQSKDDTKAMITPSKPRPRKKYFLEEMTMQLAAVQNQRKKYSSAMIQDSKEFFKLWEGQLLPALMEELEDIKGGYSINIVKGNGPDHRIIDVMTDEKLSQELIDRLDSRKQACLSSDFNSRTTFEFDVGEVEFSTSDTSSQASSQMTDPYRPAVNVGRHDDFYMGDSAGPCSTASPGCRNVSATLGPMIKIKEQAYWLMNWHVFDDGVNGINRRCNQSDLPTVAAVHPSEADLADNSRGQEVIRLGEPVAFSGPMFATSRASRLLERGMPQNGSRARETVTDWILFRAPEAAKVNKVRRIWQGQRRDSFGRNITETAKPALRCHSGRFSTLVYSNGRTSGYSFGEICEYHGTLKLPNGTVTRNWAVQSTDDHLPNDTWDLESMGVDGDSGAGIVDLLSNKLLGQLWGRNHYKGGRERHRRITYFTPMDDIFDDIQEKMPSAERPTLPRENAPVQVAGNAGAALDSISEDPVPDITDEPEELSDLWHSQVSQQGSSAGPPVVSVKCGDLISPAVHAATF